MANAQVINGCNDAEMQMNELVESRVAFFESLAHKQNFELLILLCREGPVNDAKLKAYLEQFGEVIKYDAENLQRAVIMRFYNERSKMKVQSMQLIDEYVREVNFNPLNLTVNIQTTPKILDSLCHNWGTTLQKAIQRVEQPLGRNWNIVTYTTPVSENFETASVDIDCSTPESIGGHAVQQAEKTLKSQIIPGYYGNNPRLQKWMTGSADSSSTGRTLTLFVLLLIHAFRRCCMEHHSDVFREELGHIKGAPVTLNVDSSQQPRFFKARPVPYALRTKVETELSCLQGQGMIEPVSFSDWAAPIVPVMKGDGTIRICGDYKLTVNAVHDITID